MRGWCQVRNIDKYEKEYCSTDFEQKYMVNYRRQKVLEILREYKHEYVLEIGCGMNSLAEFVTDYREFTIVEPGEYFLANVKENLKDKAGIIYFHGFIEEMEEKLQKRKYDTIIVSSLLHEVEEPIRFLKVVNSLCDANTVVHINVPNEKSIHRIIAYECGLIEYLAEQSERNILLQQNRVFNLESLEGIIHQSGETDIIDKGSYFIKPFTHSQMDKCIENGILSRQIMDGLYRLSKYLPEYGAEIFCNYRILQAGAK